MPVLLKSMMAKYILLQTVENYHGVQEFSYSSSPSPRALIGRNNFAALSLVETFPLFILRSSVMA